MKTSTYENPNGTIRKEIGSYQAAILDGNQIRFYRRDQATNMATIDHRKSQSFGSAEAAARKFERL